MYAVLTRSIPRAYAEYVWKTSPLSSLAKTLSPSRSGFDGLSELHLQELAHLAPAMHALWEALERAGDADAPEERHPAARPSA